MWILPRIHLDFVAALNALLRAERVSGVRPGMGPVLFALFRTPDATLSELAQASGLSASATTELVQRMERARLVRRRRDPSDGRAFRVSLTARGRAAEPGCRRVAAAMKGAIEAGLSAGRVADLASLLGVVALNLRNHRRA